MRARILGPGRFQRGALRTSGSILLCAFPSVAVAQSAETPPERVVVTASLFPLVARESPVFVETVAGRDIANAKDLRDALSAVPEVHVDPGGLRGPVSSVYLRGADPNHTIVMLEGIKLNDSTNIQGGSYDPTGLSLANVDRVEIAPGAS